jgi:hypothetical protein
MEKPKLIDFYGPGCVKGVMVNNRLMFQKISWKDECTIDFKRGIVADGKRRLRIKKSDSLRFIDSTYENKEEVY